MLTRLPHGTLRKWRCSVSAHLTQKFLSDVAPLYNKQDADIDGASDESQSSVERICCRCWVQGNNARGTYDDIHTPYSTIHHTPYSTIHHTAPYTIHHTASYHHNTFPNTTCFAHHRSIRKNRPTISRSVSQKALKYSLKKYQHRQLLLTLFSQ